MAEMEANGAEFIEIDQTEWEAAVQPVYEKYVGEGGIDLAGMLKNIPDPPYYSIELPNAAEVAIRGKLEHARRCLETAKTFFAAHQI